MKEGLDYLDYAVAVDDEDLIVSVMKDTIEKAEGLFKEETA